MKCSPSDVFISNPPPTLNPGAETRQTGKNLVITQTHVNRMAERTLNLIEFRQDFIEFRQEFEKKWSLYPDRGGLHREKNPPPFVLNIYEQKQLGN